MKEDKEESDLKDFENSLQEKFEDYNKRISEFSEVFFIYFDIINSTKRKDDQKYVWVQQTELLYEAVKSLEKYIINFLNKYKKKTEIVTVVKTMGDSAYILIKWDDKNINIDKSTVAKAIFDRVNKFTEIFRDKEDSTDSLRLKTVICYLTDIYLLKDNKQPVDALGRGIDFSFRIENFARHTHIITNTMFYKEICDLLSKKFNTVEVKREVKGWDGLQSFYAIYDENSIYGIEQSYKEDNIYTEILIKQLEKERQYGNEL